MILNHPTIILAYRLIISKFFAKDDQNMFDDGTWILTRANKSQFSWNYDTHERYFQHEESLLPSCQSCGHIMGPHTSKPFA